MMRQSKTHEKQVLRKSLTAQKHLLDPGEAQKQSKKILNTLSKYEDWSKVRRLHIYLPIKENNEVDTGQFLDFLRENYPDINIEIAPKKTGAEIAEDNYYDVVIVPVLGFDRRGFRLGYGGGYYDRFLARNNCRRIIGLAYSFSEIDKVPDETHDQKMHAVITEQEVISVS